LIQQTKESEYLMTFRKKSVGYEMGGGPSVFIKRKSGGVGKSTVRVIRES